MDYADKLDMMDDDCDIQGFPLESEEIWRDAVGYEGLYEVSNYGKVRHYGGAEMNGSINSYGYRTFALKRNGKRETGKGHRLVAEAFIPNPHGKRNVNHLDGNRDNNFVDNLEWATHGENINHARQELSIDYSVKPVVQKTADGHIVAVWANATMASQFNACTAQLIGACCRGTAKTAGNYVWEHGGDVFERFIRENRARTLKQEIERLSEELSQIETPTQNP